MKKVIVILCFLPMFILGSGYGQSLNDLDIKNGFRHFKFGTPPSQIKNIVKNTNQSSQNPNVIQYKYVGNDIDYVFHVKVGYISLSFFNNKLYGILIDLENFTASAFNSLLSALENAYGKNWVKVTSKDGFVLNGAAWDAKNVTLELIRVSYKGCSTCGYINVYDKKLNHAVMISEF